MVRKETRKRPVGAYLLVLIGGIFVLIGGLLTIFFGSFFGGMMFHLGYSFGSGMFALMWIFGIVSGLMMMVAASKLNTIKKSETAKWSAIALMFSILSVIDMGGFGIGFILGIVGSILGLAQGVS